MKNILAAIPSKSNLRNPARGDFSRCEERNRIGRMFGKLKQQPVSP